MIQLAPDGSFTLALSDFAVLFGQPARQADSVLEQFHMDMAASVQAVTEQVVLMLARTIRRETGARTLCLGGGMALNCVANGKLLRAGIFDDIWIQPASGPASGALGAALAATHLHHGVPRLDTAQDAFRCFMGSEIELLIVGNCVLRKEDQNPALKRDSTDAFEPD